jgi:hypothetical protein
MLGEKHTALDASALNRPEFIDNERLHLTDFRLSRMPVLGRLPSFATGKKKRQVRTYTHNTGPVHKRELTSYFVTTALPNDFRR